jgi:hypothetical protein
MKWLYIISFVLFHSSVHGQPVQKRSSLTPKEIKGLYQFKGKLNNKISVFLWFVANGSVLKGEVTYLNTKVRKPISIVGTIRLIDDFSSLPGDKTKELFAAEIYEFSKQGYIAGIYDGAFKGRHFNGTWSKPGSERELKFNLSHSDSVLAKPDTVLTTKNIAGEYLYRFGKKGSQGGIDIKQIDKTNYLISMNCVTGGPSYNVAEVAPFKVHMINNNFIYSVPNTDCKFKISFFDNFAVVTSLRGIECGFGLNASIDGVFLKTSDEAKMP